MSGIHRIILIISVGLLLGGCFNVDLKTKLPNTNYYKLDTTSIKSKSCGAYDLVGLLNIELPSHYKNNKLMYSDNSEIHEFSGVGFAGDVSSNIENIIIKAFSDECIKVVSAPFSGIMIETYLKVKILDFEVIKENMEATINLSYQVISKGVISQLGIITQSVHMDEFEPKNAIIAMQEASLKAVYQLREKLIPKY